MDNIGLFRIVEFDGTPQGFEKMISTRHRGLSEKSGVSNFDPVTGKAYLACGLMLQKGDCYITKYKETNETNTI